MKRSLFIIFALLFSNLSAQVDSVASFSVGANIGYGFVIPHSPIINFLANRPITQQEVYLETQNLKNRLWHRNHNFPVVGLLLSRFDLKNDRHIGEVYALSPYTRFSLIKGKRANLKIRTSLGLGYIQKPFEAQDNFKNAAIGSKINMFISLQLSGELALYKGLGLNYGIGFSHLSNTGFQKPNLGFNMATLYSGFHYKFGEEASIEQGQKMPPLESKPYWYISAGLGLNDLNPPGGRKYLAKGLFVRREKRIGRNASIAGGLDFFFNPAHIDFLESFGRSISSIENVQIAISASHILHFGKLDFTSQLSYYIKNENDDLGSVYHLFGGRWHLDRSYSVFFIGKTHISRAEYVMFGIGKKLGNVQ